MRPETLSSPAEREQMPDHASTEDEMKLVMLLEQRGAMAAELAQNPHAHELKVEWFALLNALIGMLEIKIDEQNPENKKRLAEEIGNLEREIQMVIKKLGPHNINFKEPPIQ